MVDSVSGSDELLARLKKERDVWLAESKKEYLKMRELYDAKVAGFEEEISALESLLNVRQSEVDLSDVEIFFEGDHPTATSVEFKGMVKELRDHRKAMVKAKTAITSDEKLGLNGDATEGEKLFSELSKLMLRAYNNEGDALVRQINVGNVKQKTVSLDKKRDDIHRLGQRLGIRIADEYHRLFKQEMEMTQKWKVVQEREKEAKREERDRIAEEKKVEAEIKAERDRLEKERQLKVDSLRKMEELGELTADVRHEFEDEIHELERATKEVDKRTANTRAGYVYVISNPGSFGGEVVKIGLTRRLEPMDRVKELGDASVPFRFSVHAIIYSDDAVTLENELHERFDKRRVNRVNRRKEFFFVGVSEVREALTDLNAHLVEFEEEAHNDEWEASQ